MPKLGTLGRIHLPLVLAAMVALLGPTLIAAPVAAGAGGVSVATILTGYSKPVFVTHRGGGKRIYVVEKRGTIQIAKPSNGRWVKVGTFLDISDRVKGTSPEQGLLGLAFAPDYATSRKLYVSYTRKPDGDLVIAEYRRRSTGADRARKGSHRLVMTIGRPKGGRGHHNGGMIAFGPDGWLYIGSGDGSATGDSAKLRAQDLNDLLGKMLRIDPRDPDGTGPKRYRIPASNPFHGDADRRWEIWSRGLRNPWRWSFDRVTGDLWIGDVGQQEQEEIDKAKANRNRRNAGKADNYGWGHCEGVAHISGPACETFDGPLLHYESKDPASACAVIGGYVYRGTKWPAWSGYYVFADFCSGQLWVANQAGSIVGPQDGVQAGRTFSSFGEDAAGRLYATDYLAGRIMRVRFSGDP